MKTRPVELTEHEYWILLQLMIERRLKLKQSGDYPERDSDNALINKLVKEHNQLILRS